MRQLITARALLTPERTIERPWLLIEDGVIAALGAQGESELPAHGAYLDFPGATLAPAFLDIHVHGGAGYDVMDTSPEALATVARFLASRGVGAFCPTTVTAPVDRTLRALEGMASVIEAVRARSRPGAAVPLGIHLEGPFLSHAKRGVHPPEHLQAPSIALFDRFWQAARGSIRLLTLAPELPGALDLIAHATQLGVRVSLGHSDASADEAYAGIIAGAHSATHTFNAMRGLDHREPGIAAAVLDSVNLYAELICDGVHVDPAMVRLFWKMKGPERSILITDAMSATGMPEGRYLLGGLEVDVREGRCMRHGVLAGSVLTMDRAVRNFAEFTRAPLAAVLRSATCNPAALIGEDRAHGCLCVGRRADLVILNPEREVLATMVGGVLAS